MEFITSYFMSESYLDLSECNTATIQLPADSRDMETKTWIWWDGYEETDMMKWIWREADSWSVVFLWISMLAKLVTVQARVLSQAKVRLDPHYKYSTRTKKKGINAPWYGNSLDSGMLTDQFRHSVTIPCCDSVFPQYKWVYVYQVGVVVLLYLYLLVRTQEIRQLNHLISFFIYCIFSLRYLFP